MRMGLFRFSGKRILSCLLCLVVLNCTLAFKQVPGRNRLFVSRQAELLQKVCRRKSQLSTTQEDEQTDKKEMPAVDSKKGLATGQFDPALLAQLKKAGRREDKAKFLEVMDACFEQAKVYEKVDFMGYTEMLNASLRLGDAAIVHKVIERSEGLGITHSELSMGRIVHKVAKARQWFLVSNLLFYMRMKGLTPTNLTYTQVVAEMAKNRQFFLINDFLRTEAVTMSQSIYNALISGCSKAREVDRAFYYFRKMQADGFARDHVTYGSVLGAVKQTGDVDRAFDLFHQMKAEGVVPDEYCYNTLMALCARRGEYERALGLFEAMRVQGVERDVISYNTAMSACERIGDDHLAMGILKTMLEAGVVPDEITFNTAISACGKARNWRDAQKLFDKMGKFAVPTTTVTCNALISALVRGGQWEAALAQFEAMGAAGVPPDFVSYGSALHAAFVGGDADRALALLRAMAAEGLRPNTVCLGTAVHTCVRAGRLRDALQVYRGADRLGCQPNVVVMQVLLNGCAAAGELDWAVEVLDDMAAGGRPARGGAAAAAAAAARAPVGPEGEGGGELHGRRDREKGGTAARPVVALELHNLNSALEAAAGQPETALGLVAYARKNLRGQLSINFHNTALRCLARGAAAAREAGAPPAELARWAAAAEGVLLGARADGHAPNVFTLTPLKAVVAGACGRGDRYRELTAGVSGELLASI